jgi:hypothetical protein
LFDNKKRGTDVPLASVLGTGVERLLNRRRNFCKLDAQKYGNRH